MKPFTPAQADTLVNDPYFAPYFGWHDDHRHLDRSPEYRPAVQQVRQEFLNLAQVCRDLTPCRRALQLGLGATHAAHELLGLIFDTVATVDLAECIIGDDLLSGYRTADPIIRRLLARRFPDGVDLLFIDADHTLLGVQEDHRNYESLVAPGGIVAFHDALKRPGYEREVEVWHYLAANEYTQFQTTMIGTEVGVAWYRKP